MTQQTQDQGGGQDDSQGGGYDRYDRDDGRRLKADPVLTKYFDDLEKALHGARPGRTREPLTWNGVGENTVTLDSIKTELDKSIPPARPLPDQQGKAGTAQTGN